LLESYDEERGHGSDENIRHSARSTRFMTPKTAAERDFRDGVLALAHDFPFARQLVNGGRLSKPCDLAGLSLQTPGAAGSAVPPGAPCPDVPLEDAAGRPSWLLNHLGGMFALLHVAPHPPVLSDRFRRACGDLKLILISPPGQNAAPAANSPDWIRLTDREGLFAARYGGAAQATWLIRPDQHVAACFAAADEARMLAALAQAGMMTEARP
jgi:3-(3-hydroxy-phenyl)propionate hydroxylase